MTRHCRPAVLLFFGVLHLTGCASVRVSPDSPVASYWQDGLSNEVLIPISPAQYLKEYAPERVRVIITDGTQYEVLQPAIEGDALVAHTGLSIPLADIRRLEAGFATRVSVMKHLSTWWKRNQMRFPQ